MTAIEVTVITKWGGEFAYHARGCAHQHASNVAEVHDRDQDVEFLDAIAQEAKELGCKSPIAPCLRKALR